jgi:hypothetical protein
MYIPLICICKDKYKWDNINKLCPIDCTVIPNAVTIPTSIIACSCGNGYHWDVATLSCLANRRLLFQQKILKLAAAI